MSDQYRPFGRKKRQLAEIDPEMCTGCGYCAMFCVMACIHQQATMPAAWASRTSPPGAA